jgi:hypothetical protein
VTTLDIAFDLLPYVVGALPFLPFARESFDLVAAFQLLEHLPYVEALRALTNIWHVTRRYFVFSVPDRNRNYQLQVKLPFVGLRRWMIELPRLRPPSKVSYEQHYWEIGMQDYPLSRILNDKEGGLRFAKDISRL